MKVCEGGEMRMSIIECEPSLQNRLSNRNNSIESTKVTKLRH